MAMMLKLLAVLMAVANALPQTEELAAAMPSRRIETCKSQDAAVCNPDAAEGAEGEESTSLLALHAQWGRPWYDANLQKCLQSRPSGGFYLQQWDSKKTNGYGSDPYSKADSKQWGSQEKKGYGHSPYGKTDSKQWGSKQKKGHGPSPYGKADSKQSGHSYDEDSAVCNWVDQFIVTRLWTVLEPQTSKNVVKEFKEGFAPVVTKIPGFLAYLGATTDLPDRSFFANVFQTLEGALAAQEGAQEFVANGELNGTIEPFLFTTGQIKFQFTSHRLCKMKWPMLKGKWLSIRTWRPEENSSAQQILDIFEAGFGPVVSQFRGFNMYLGAKVQNMTTGESFAFFLNIFDTEHQAEFANAQAVAFADGEGKYAWQPCGGLVAERATLINAQTAKLRFAFVATKIYNSAEKYHKIKNKVKVAWSATKELH
jgi:hypothetical protein